MKSAGRDDLRLRLLAVLTADSYIPERPFISIDWLKLDYAQLRHDTGDTALAQSLVADIKDPSIFIELLLDPRFRNAFAEDYDVRPMVEAKLKNDRATLARHDDLLSGLIEVARSLRLLGRPQAALDILERATANIDTPGYFSDEGDELTWWWCERARNYSALGRVDDAVLSLKKGGEVDESGNLNVSQLLNLAELQMKSGRDKDAIETLRAFDDPKRIKSPYGEMVMRFVRGCAFAKTGRPADAAADLSYVMAHEKDHAGAVTTLLLCTGNLDDGAASIIRRLADPQKRLPALLALSEFDAPPVATTSDPSETLFSALKERADVKAAIQRAGGTRRFHIQHP